MLKKTQYQLSRHLLAMEGLCLVPRRVEIKREGIRVPVYLSDRTEQVTAEIQIRTIAMDFWASLEHDIRYKVDKTKLPEGINEEMLECAGKIAEIDRQMQEMYRRIKSAQGNMDC